MQKVSSVENTWYSYIYVFTCNHNNCLHPSLVRCCCSLWAPPHCCFSTPDSAPPVPPPPHHSSSTLSLFTQYVKCHTRVNKILDLLYANLKEGYTSSPLSPLGRWDHNLVHLLPDYIPVVNTNLPQEKSMNFWTKGPEKSLRDCFDTTDWEALCSPHGVDINSLTDCMTDDIHFCVQNVVSSRRVQCFPDNKLWVNSGIKSLLDERVFRSGDIDELRRVQKEIETGNKEGEKQL